MNTGFSIQIAGWPEKQARQASLEAFAEIDRLERLLSRFIEGSDVDRINSADAGVPIRVTSDAFDCIWAALNISILSEGAFDPTAGSIDPATIVEGEAPPDYRGITINEAALTVSKGDPRLRLDLGGVGKGFAVDIARETLREWEAPSAMITAGGSTASALGKPGLGIWSGELGEGMFRSEIDLAQYALASSGTGVKGDHILDTRSGRGEIPRRRTWATAISATAADALSTAFFLLPPEKIQTLCEQCEGVGAAWIDHGHPIDTPPATAGTLEDIIWSQAS